MRLLNFKLLIISVLILISALNSTAQNGTYVTVQDLELWSAVEVKYKLNKRWSFQLEEQWRLKDNARITDQYFTELSATRTFKKKLFVTIGGRYIGENDNVGKIQGYENHLRWMFDLGYKQKMNRFELQGRVRYQTKNELGISKEEGDLADNTLRFKLASEYNIPKWKFDPELSGEIFRDVSDLKDFSKFRFTVGTSYSFKKLGKLAAFYRLEKQLNTTYPKTTNIVAVKYAYTFKHKKNDK
ncbi:MAG: hypothetical protein ACI8ZN_000521 [Bacteroidia bacterium]|jgi:hypothetical protein